MKRIKKNNIPTYKTMFLYRQGLKLTPSKNFIDKFKEIYLELWEQKGKKEYGIIDDNTAIFFINTVLESIIYCLDFGFDVWLNRVFVFLQKQSCYVNERFKKGYSETKKFTLRPITSIILKIKNKINKNNVEYQDFIRQKKDRYVKIKKYYKDFYGQEDWWKSEN